MKRLIAIALTSLVMTSTAAFAKDKAPFSLAKGTQIGVVNLLDPEVMHYHAGKKTIDSYVKVQPVNWNVDEMLITALRPPSSRYFTPKELAWQTSRTCTSSRTAVPSGVG